MQYGTNTGATSNREDNYANYTDNNIQVLSVQGQYQPEDPSIKYIDRIKFNEAVDRGIFPQLNGLVGLINNINYWATFNNFSRDLQAGSDLSKEKREREFLNDIFTYTDSEYESPENDENFQDRWYGTVGTTAKRHGYGIESINYLTRLAQYQSNSFERLLMRKLSLEKPSQLRDYVIPRGDNLKQAYIRWDALVCLFNEFLIPQSDKGKSFFITTDRIYDTDNNNSKLDPLLYCPISNYNKIGENNIYDFSCDANVCILPHQFGEVPKEGALTIDVLGLDKVFGYTPNLSVFATDYLLSIYKKERSHYYNNKLITIGGGTLMSSMVGEEYPPSRPSESELKPSDRYRRIGSIFLNVNMLTEIAEKNEDNEKYTLGQYINDIWEKVNKTCPNHNFVLTDDKESNTLFIIDLPVDNTELPTDFHEFIPFSNKNVLRNFDYTSNVPSSLSSTIAVQSQNPRSIRDIDGVTFAAFNKAIKNRIFSKDTTSNLDKTKSQLESEQSRIVSRQQQLQLSLLQYQQTFFKNIKLADTEKSLIGEGNIIGQLKEYQKNASYMSISLQDTNSFNSVIPLEFSATLDGISGMVIGNIFKVQKDRLPKAYKNSNIGFILFNEEQSITAGGDWTTNISGKMTILPKKKITIKGITIEIPAKEDAVVMQPTEAVTENTNTSDVLAGQNLTTNIGDAVLNSIVYLKAMKDNSPSRPQAIGTSISTLNVTDLDSIGYAFVRFEPWVNNERGLLADNYSDNAIGAFDSWNKINETSKFESQGWATQPLGAVVAVDPNDPNYIPGREDPDSGNQHLEYPQGEGKCIVHHKNNRIQLLPEFLDKYTEKLVNPPPKGYLFFTYDKDATYHFNSTLEGKWYAIKVDNDKKPIENTTNFELNDYGPAYYKFVEDLTLFTFGGTDQFILIAEEDATTQAHVWYNIQFSKEASNAFNKGWTLGKSKPLFSSAYTYIDTDGADTQGNIPALDTKLALDEYSAIYNTWMHHSVLATTQESAAQLFIIEEANSTGGDKEGTVDNESPSTPQSTE
tara:strand:- start:946 stop:4029 length:3084 start_codon:yes stop_codon:yes gene_type:complete